MLLTIITLISMLYTNKLNFNENYKIEDIREKSIEFSERTGRVHSGMASMEYMPSKMFNNKDYVINRKDEAIILDSDQTEIKYQEKDASNMTLVIENAEAGTTIELPYTYYIGYRIYENGNEIKYSESDYGFIQISLQEEGEVTITVKYLGTNLMLISFVISILAGIVLIIIQVRKYNKENKIS